MDQTKVPPSDLLGRVARAGGRVGAARGARAAGGAGRAPTGARQLTAAGHAARLALRPTRCLRRGRFGLLGHRYLGANFVRDTGCGEVAYACCLASAGHGNLLSASPQLPAQKYSGATLLSTGLRPSAFCLLPKKLAPAGLLNFALHVCALRRLCSICFLWSAQSQGMGCGSLRETFAWS